MSFTIPDDELIRVIKDYYSVASLLRDYGMYPAGGNYRSFYIKVKELGLDTSHFVGQGVKPNKQQKNEYKPPIPLEEILVENSDYTNTARLKKRLVDAGYLEYRCSICGIVDWCDKPITLHLDHINGVNSDHRLENLRICCPNCHSQTETYGGKNIGKYFYNKRKDVNIDGRIIIPDRECKRCNQLFKPKVKRQIYCSKQCYKKINYSSDTYHKNCLCCDKDFTTKHKGQKYCSYDCAHQSQHKVDRPSREQLESEIKTMSFCELGRKYGVSDNAVRKWAKNYGLPVNKR